MDMTNNANNLIPTGPDDTGNWYREGGEIVLVKLNNNTNLFSGLVYYRHGSQHAHSVSPDGLWLGPVPEHGKWAPMDLFNQLWTALSMTNPPRGSVDYMLLQRAREWDDPEVTR
jgi:hypothetical protein